MGRISTSDTAFYAMLPGDWTVRTGDHNNQVMIGTGMETGVYIHAAHPKDVPALLRELAYKLDSLADQIVKGKGD